MSQGQLPIEKSNLSQASSTNASWTPTSAITRFYKGCHQIVIKKSNEEKTAFYTSEGIFCYKKMSFGLKSARAMYQASVIFIGTCSYLNLKDSFVNDESSDQTKIHFYNSDNQVDQVKTTTSKNDEKEEIDNFQDTYEHDGWKVMLKDLNISELTVKRQRLKIKDRKA
ncbi:hypothetical protein Tco_1338615 [Tanacetum coccineum]